MGKNEQQQKAVLEFDHLNTTDFAGKSVAIGVTGRLDSTVACLLLKKQGMKVYAIHVVNFKGGEFTEKDGFHCYTKNLDEISQVYQDLGIAFYAVDAKSEFFDKVMENYIHTKFSGQIYNGCFSCQKLKMNLVYEKMKKLDADFFATGHFAKAHKNFFKNEFNIMKANDLEADQSMYLAGLTQEQIAHILLPLGDLKQEEVQKIASKFIPNIIKPSNNFLGRCLTKSTENKLNYLEHHIPTSLKKTGPVSHVSTENYYGEHEGVHRYEIGAPNVVFKTIGTKIDKDSYIVGYRQNNLCILLGTINDLSFSNILVKVFHTFKGFEKYRPFNVDVFISKIEKFVPAILFFKNSDFVSLQFQDPIYPLLVNDNIVVYQKSNQNNKILCSGVIKHCFNFKQIDRVAEYRPPEDDEDLMTPEELEEKKKIKKTTKFTY